ncbi:membrane associated transmembrane domain near C [Cryptosporidium sp. chipmunk genotype I]|uniref:membrane associated transmembrane domain near C n=1 Tax=Cryptosporidium sp. chipmunk genotype I TaxID=1280935 RepID=UPI00351A27B8|nr:membrane associated transmembrane domain near C [Cryptosporidium sp. chipmunk genotype I]
MRILKTLQTHIILCILLATGLSKATVSRSTLNCKYQLIPEFIDGLGYGNHELYHSETRGIRHEPENKIILNIRYESVITLSLERSFDSDLDFSYLRITQANNEELAAEANLTWGGAGNNTRLFLRTKLMPSQYLIVIGSNFIKNEDDLEKIDDLYCSPINFEFGLTTPDIINSISSLSLNDPFKKPLINLSSDEKYEYINQIDDSFVVRTTPLGVNYSSKLYKATILWSKLFVIPSSRSKEEKLLKLNIELGFKFSRMPLQLVIEPLRVEQAHRELESHQINESLRSRVFFGTPIYNGQLFKENISQKSFRIVVIAPWMDHAPRFAKFDLKIAISFQTHSEKLSNEILSSQNVCSLPKLPTKILQDGLFSEKFQDLRKPSAISSNHLLFGPKLSLHGPFESLTSHTNHVIHIQTSRPSIFYLLSHHDHSDIAIALSKSPEISEEDEDLEFFFDDIFDSEDSYGHTGKSTPCTSKNLNHAGVTSKEMNLIYCKVNEPGDYYLHIHSYKISESQNSVSLCTPFHLNIEIFPISSNTSGCSRPINAHDFKLQISPNPNNRLKRSYITPDISALSISSTVSGFSKIHTQEFRVKDLAPTYLSIQLQIPEHPLSLVFINVLFDDKIWMSLTPHTLHNFFASAGPLVSGTYKLQIFATIPENFDIYELECIKFDSKISLVQLPSKLNGPGPGSSSNNYGSSNTIYEQMNAEEESQFIKCQTSQMTLPQELDLTHYLKGEEYILDGTFLVPLEEYEMEGTNIHESEHFLKEAFVSYTITLYLSHSSVLKASITNYPGLVIISARNKNPTKIGPNDSTSFFAEFNKGTHDLIFEFDLIEEGVDEKLEEGGCPTFRLHLSIISIEDLPIFPPLVLPELYKYVTERRDPKTKQASEWSHTELFSISKDYLKKMLPESSLIFDLSKNMISIPNQDLNKHDKNLVHRGDLFEIREMIFWFSPFMQISVPLSSDLEEISLNLILEVYPAWIPITVKLFEGSETNSDKKARHNFVRYNNFVHTGNKIEYSFPSIKEGKYKLLIQSKNQFTKLTMGRSALLKVSGSIKPTLKNRLFSLRQELISIPDILPFQELPDSLNRIRFLSESHRGFVSTIMFNLKETKVTKLKVPESETHLLRILSEPTLISGYEFYVTIFKTKEGDKEFKNHPIFMSGKYGDTLALLSSGEYEIQFSPAPNNMPYLITFGLIKFNPVEYENFFRKNLSLPKVFDNESERYGSVGVVGTGRVRGTVGSVEKGVSKMTEKEIFGPRQKCHYYLENFKISLNEENSPYFNSGIINICQGQIMTRSKLSTFSSSIHDLKLNVASSSIVYLQTHSDFLYSFYRIGIIVPEGFWVAEQRGTQSYLEVELTKGQYILRIESLNSFSNYEEHEILLFSIFVEVSPIDGSETALESSDIIDNSLDLDTSKNKGLSQSNINSKCHIPNGVPLPLDLTSIQGGSTVFGGPLDTNKPMFVFRSRITLTDIHNGRKKVFFELNKKLFPTFLRLSLSPVNFDISESPNMLEVLFTKINSTPINPMYTNLDSLLNSVEKVFKVDIDTIGNEHAGALNIPFWLTFTHKLDSINNRIPCIAFDIIVHTVSPQNQDIKFLNPPPFSTQADTWFNSIQSKLNRALSTNTLPQYIHLPPSNVILSLNSNEFETDLLLDLKKISPGQALLIADLYYNPLLVSSKLTLYSEPDESQHDENDREETSSEVALIKSSLLHFNGNISTPLYAMERITAILTAQKHLLECSIKSLPPFNLKNVPIMLGISLIPISHDISKNHPLIVSITPDPSVPIIAGQNLHLTIRLSTPLMDRKAPKRLSKSIYIIGKSGSDPEERLYPYHLHIFDAGYTVSVSYSYHEFSKIFSESQEQFSKRGFLVIDTNSMSPKNFASFYKVAPWISVYLETKNKFLIEISGYRANSVGWGNIVWDGDWNAFRQKNRQSQTSNIRGQNFIEKDSLQTVKLLDNPFSESSNQDYSHGSVQESDADRLSRKVIYHQIDPTINIDNIKFEVPEQELLQKTVDSKRSTRKMLLLLIIVIVCSIAVYHSPIYTPMKNSISYMVSKLTSNRNKREYNLLGDRNDFDFLNNAVSDDEEQDSGEFNNNLSNKCDVKHGCFSSPTSDQKVINVSQPSLVNPKKSN